MRPSNKGRTRGKSHRRSAGNTVNRVFESSGPEGKVRGNPQQIIDKYQTLARDASLVGDRVASENFAQHSEHYIRMLGDAQRELDARREQQEGEAARRRENEPRNESGQSFCAEQGNPLTVIDAEGGVLAEKSDGNGSSAQLGKRSDQSSRRDRLPMGTGF